MTIMIAVGTILDVSKSAMKTTLQMTDQGRMIPTMNRVKPTGAQPTIIAIQMGAGEKCGQGRGAGLPLTCEHSDGIMIGIRERIELVEHTKIIGGSKAAGATMKAGASFQKNSQ
jgi:hypothetical protein